jgi:hypothetical protein
VAERKGPRYQAFFSVVHIRCSVPYFDILSHEPRKQRTYACVGCTLAMTKGQGLISSRCLADHREAQANLQAFRYALNLSAEGSGHVQYADAMHSRPLLACVEYLRRRQVQSHLRGHRWHECSTRPVGYLENEIWLRCAPLGSHPHRIARLVYAMSQEG